MVENETVLLNHLDKPAKLFGFPADELGVFIIAFFGGIFSDWIIMGFSLGVGLTYALRLIKKRQSGRSMNAAIYWHMGLPKSMMKLYVPSHVREWVG